MRSFGRTIRDIGNLVVALVIVAATAVVELAIGGLTAVRSGLHCFHRRLS